MTTVEDIERVMTEPGSCRFCKRIEPADELHHSNVTMTNVHTICLSAALMRNDPIAEQISRELCPA